jgi:hypothetical protein
MLSCHQGIKYRRSVDGLFRDNQNIESSGVTRYTDRVWVEKLVTEVASNGLTTVTADCHGRATDDLEDSILEEEDQRACT